MSNLTGLTGLRANSRIRVTLVDDPSLIPPSDRPSESLDNKIHPLWRFNAFRDISFQESDYSQRKVDNPNQGVRKVFYDRITPALRLASILLERARPLLIRILRGPIHRDADNKTTVDQTWEPSPADYAAYEEDLLDLAMTFRVLYSDPMPPGDDGMAMALCHFKINTDALTQLGAPITVVACALCAEFLAEFDMDALWNRKDSFQKATLWLSVADALLHELAHALWYKRLVDESRLFSDPAVGAPHLLTPEPNIWPETFHELGQSVNRYLWTHQFQLRWGLYRTQWDIKEGITQPVFRPMFDGSLGLNVNVENLNADYDTRSIFILSRASTFAMFDKHTWEASEVSIYMLPRPGNKPTATANLEVDRVPPQKELTGEEFIREVRDFNLRHGYSISGDYVAPEHFEEFFEELQARGCYT